MRKNWEIANDDYLKNIIASSKIRKVKEQIKSMKEQLQKDHKLKNEHVMTSNSYVSGQIRKYRASKLISPPDYVGINNRRHFTVQRTSSPLREQFDSPLRCQT